VYGPHRHLDRERQEEGDEDQDLLIEPERQTVEIGDQVCALPCLARLQVQVDERDEHEHRAQERVEKELDRRIHAARSAPHADDDEHRDEHRFPKDVEEQCVERREHADHEPFKDEEGREILCWPVLNRIPGSHHHQRRDEGGQDDERHRDAVDAERVQGIECRNPAQLLDKLHLRRGHIEVRVEER